MTQPAVAPPNPCAFPRFPHLASCPPLPLPGWRDAQHMGLSLSQGRSTEPPAEKTLTTCLGGARPILSPASHLHPLICLAAHLQEALGGSLQRLWVGMRQSEWGWLGEEDKRVRQEGQLRWDFPASPSTWRPA